MFCRWRGFACFGAWPRSRSRQFLQRRCFWRLVISLRACKTDRPLRCRFQFLPFLPHLKWSALVSSRIFNNLEKQQHYTTKPTLCHSFQRENQHRIKGVTVHDVKCAPRPAMNRAISRLVKGFCRSKKGSSLLSHHQLTALADWRYGDAGLVVWQTHLPYRANAGYGSIWPA